MRERRVVVTGLGPVCANWLGRESFWDGQVAGESGIATIAEVDGVTAAGLVTCDFLQIVPPNDRRGTDRFSQLALAAAHLAINDASLSRDQFGSDVGVFFATGIGGLSSAEAMMQQAGKRISPLAIPSIMPNAAAAAIARSLNCHGPVIAVSSACASSADAVVQGIQSIQLEECEVAIVGGTEATATTIGIRAFAALRALAVDTPNPRTASRPFDSERNGFVLAEGAAGLVLEEYEHAVARNAKIYAEILGYGRTNDAFRMTDPLPSGYHAARAIKKALAMAKTDLSSIDYINAHAPSTVLGDASESAAVESLCDDFAPQFCVHASKGGFGHALGAAAALELVSTIMSISTDLVLPTLNTRHSDLYLGQFLIKDNAIKRQVNLVVKNSFGFGGHNVSLILAKL